MLTATKTTFAEYAALPESNRIIELIDGEIIVTSPSDAHQKTLWFLVMILLPALKTGTARFAPSGVYLDDENSFEPDLFWISTENTRCVLGSDGRFWRGAPDLVFEVLLPTTAYRDRGIKFEVYERSGVREYWLIDPQAEILEVYTRKDDRFARLGVFRHGETFTSPLLGLALELKVLFPDPPQHDD